MSRMFLSPRQVDLAESHDFCVDSELRHHLAALNGSWLVFSKPIQQSNDNCPYPCEKEHISVFFLSFFLEQWYSKIIVHLNLQVSMLAF